MKTLIFIILKIWEIAVVVLSLILVAVGIIVLFDWVFSDSINEWLINWLGTLVNSTVWYIIVIPIWIWCAIIIIRKDLKPWITQNKEWSEKIYNKLKH